jgi:hypothetical protein
MFRRLCGHLQATEIYKIKIPNAISFCRVILCYNVNISVLMFGAKCLIIYQICSAVTYYSHASDLQAL